MYKVLVLYPAPKDPEHFRSYYVGQHLPLAARLPGLKSSRYTFNVVGEAGDAPYFCIWEGEFEDGPSAGAAMQSEIGQQVAADVANYATGGHQIVHYQLESLA